MKLIKIFIFITTFLVSANYSFSGQTTVEGKVTKIGDNTITIRTSMTDSIPAGSRVDLFFEVSEGQSLPVGQWAVSSAGNGLVYATPVDVLGPPQEGMTAQISFPERKEQVQVIRQDHHNSQPMSQDEEPYKEKQFVYDPPQDAEKAKDITNEGHKGAKTGLDPIKPQIRGKEPKGQLLGIPFPEKSVDEYINEGNKYYSEKNYKMAIKEYEQCARMGNAECQGMMGFFYDKGFGVKKDWKKAYEFYEESARQDNLAAIYNLGVMYVYGQGIKKNSTKARELFLKAANMGHPSAQFNLGILYYQGMGGVKKDKTTALKWIKKAADQNIPQAVYFVGQAYEFGWGTPKNMSKATEYYKKAAELGEENAIKKLTEI
jgi:TPR repeat protein